jgi:hypothetical protein
MRRLAVVLGVGLLMFVAGCNSSKSESTPIPGRGEGSTSTPTTLSVGVPHSGGIGGFGQSYYQFTATSADRFTIAVTNTLSDLSWRLYSTLKLLAPTLTCDAFSWRADEICATNQLIPGTTYYIVVEEHELVPGSYNVVVRVGGGEGLPSAPVPVALNTPHGGYISGNGDSHYLFNADSAGGEHRVTTQPNAQTSTYWDLIEVSTGNYIAGCYTDQNLTGTACSTNFLNAGAQYHLRFWDAVMAAGSYTFTVALGAPVGSLNNPLGVAVNAAAQGTNFNGSWNYYALFAATTTGQHTVTATNAGWWYLYDYLSMTLLVTCGPGPNPSCPVTGLASGTTYLIQFGALNSPQDNFTLRVTQP